MYPDVPETLAFLKETILFISFPKCDSHNHLQTVWRPWGTEQPPLRVSSLEFKHPSAEETALETTKASRPCRRALLSDIVLLPAKTVALRTTHTVRATQCLGLHSQGERDLPVCWQVTSLRWWLLAYLLFCEYGHVCSCQSWAWTDKCPFVPLGHHWDTLDIGQACSAKMCLGLPLELSGKMIRS